MRLSPLPEGPIRSGSTLSRSAILWRESGAFAFAKDFALKFRRAALHSADLEFCHPVDGKLMRFHSELPPDMREFLENN